MKTKTGGAWSYKYSSSRQRMRFVLAEKKDVSVTWAWERTAVESWSLSTKQMSAHRSVSFQFGPLTEEGASLGWTTVFKISLFWAMSACPYSKVWWHSFFFFTLALGQRWSSVTFLTQSKSQEGVGGLVVDLWPATAAQRWIWSSSETLGNLQVGMSSQKALSMRNLAQRGRRNNRWASLTTRR